LDYAKFLFVFVNIFDLKVFTDGIYDISLYHTVKQETDKKIDQFLFRNNMLYKSGYEYIGKASEYG